jgi:hypothetical protein
MRPGDVAMMMQLRSMMGMMRQAGSTVLDGLRTRQVEMADLHDLLLAQTGVRDDQAAPDAAGSLAAGSRPHGRPGAYGPTQCLVGGRRPGG